MADQYLGLGTEVFVVFSDASPERFQGRRTIAAQSKCTPLFLGTTIRQLRTLDGWGGRISAGLSAFAKTHEPSCTMEQYLSTDTCPIRPDGRETPDTSGFS